MTITPVAPHAVSEAPDPSFLIDPGLGGSGPDHWQTAWADCLPRCSRVVQRDWDRPDRETWLQALRQAIEAAGAPVVAVAHSLGCALVAHAVSRWPGLIARGVRGALLVAPADVDSPAHTPPETRGFAPMPLARLPFPATVMARRPLSIVIQKMSACCLR